MKKWSWREESNLQPAVYKTAALPLSYASLTPILAYLDHFDKSLYGPPLPDSIPEQVGDKRRGQVWALGLVVQQGLSRRWVAKAMGCNTA